MPFMHAGEVFAVSAVGCGTRSNCRRQRSGPGRGRPDLGTRVKEGGDDRGTTAEAKPNIAYLMLSDASNRLAPYGVAALRAAVSPNVRSTSSRDSLVPKTGRSSTSFWTAHGFAINGELDTREHFAGHALLVASMHNRQVLGAGVESTL
jgi:hypothetical protein